MTDFYQVLNGVVGFLSNVSGLVIFNLEVFSRLSLGSEAHCTAKAAATPSPISQAKPCVLTSPAVGSGVAGRLFWGGQRT